MNQKTSAAQTALPIEKMASLKSWGEPPRNLVAELDKQASINCGWGRLIFGQTFTSNTELAQQLAQEQPGQRDVAFYIRDPQVVVSKAPQQLFIDPSLTYRLDLTQPRAASAIQGVSIRPMTGGWDEHHVNRIYKSRGMVTLQRQFTEHLLSEPALTLLVAEDNETGALLGCVTGVDHHALFQDPDNGSSLWALAVDPQCLRPGIGKALVEALAQHFCDAGRSFMDLSVMHDNQQAIELYRSMGFYQIPVYCIKTKNAINERLYVGPKPDEQLNVYAQIIIDEAYRRGINVEITDAAGGFFDLSLGGRTISCRESLTDLTSAVALSRCDNKQATHTFLRRVGLATPEQSLLASQEEAESFLWQHKRIVIKPAQGEQGQGVCVDLRSAQAVHEAYLNASQFCDQVIGERFIEGQDLRILVINDEVVAAAVRKPATIIGDGTRTIQELIAKQSRRREAATQGESSIPMDDETRRCVTDAEFTLDDILPYGFSLQVRKTANLHTGGTLHDVTDKLHPVLIDAAIRAAQALSMPLVGLDLIVSDPSEPEYVIIEANERPGLANHEPQPTAEKLIDMLFPQSATMKR